MKATQISHGKATMPAPAAARERGLLTDEADGVLGTRTREALTAFQRQQGIQVSGSIDTRTVAALGVSNRISAMQGQSTTVGQGQAGQQPPAQQNTTGQNTGQANAPAQQNPPAAGQPQQNPPATAGQAQQNQPATTGQAQQNQPATTGQAGSQQPQGQTTGQAPAQGAPIRQAPTRTCRPTSPRRPRRLPTSRHRTRRAGDTSLQSPASAGLFLPFATNDRDKLAPRANHAGDPAHERRARRLEAGTMGRGEGAAAAVAG
jgi:hypothetical protein